MGKNRLQQAVYDYLHSDKILPYKLLIRVRKYFDRANFWDAIEVDKRIKYKERKGEWDEGDYKM